MKILLLFITFGFITNTAIANNYEIDKESGLIMAPNWELVKAQCSVCHTPAIIPQNPGSRQAWENILQWMIKTQGLWELSDTWDPILTYLSDYYGEKKLDLKTFRRLPLPKSQQPAMH